jgi:hypothetical protein
VTELIALVTVPTAPVTTGGTEATRLGFELLAVVPDALGEATGLEPELTGAEVVEPLLAEVGDEAGATEVAVELVPELVAVPSSATTGPVAELTTVLDSPSAPLTTGVVELVAVVAAGTVEPGVATEPTPGEAEEPTDGEGDVLVRGSGLLAAGGDEEPEMDEGVAEVVEGGCADDGVVDEEATDVSTLSTTLSTGKTTLPRPPKPDEESKEVADACVGDGTVGGEESETVGDGVPAARKPSILLVVCSKKKKNTHDHLNPNPNHPAAF